MIVDLQVGWSCLLPRRHQPDWPFHTDLKRLDSYSVVVMYNTTLDRIWIDSGEIPTRSKEIEEANMKSIRLMLPVFLIALATVAFAQSDAQKSFDTLKALAGYLARPRDSQPSAIRVGRQARVGLAPRYFQGKCPRT
jgi:hypothetical protein